MTEDPSPPIPQLTIDHGTGVAGVAIARGWNGKGSRGTAPFASVVGYVSANEPTPEIGAAFNVTFAFEPLPSSATE